MWEESSLTIAVSDMRGIKENIEVRFGNKELAVEPGSRIAPVIQSGFTANLNKIRLDSSRKGTDFSFDLKLQGSKHLNFIPLGETTQVNLSSDWTAPSFDGAFLPDKREITDNGFKAQWKLLQLNRNFPQKWIDSQNVEDIWDSCFGVKLLIPLDDYQKSMRSAKYALMTISLTFLIFFLVEIMNDLRIHPFQYILVGLALCLFYSLLIAISEHSNFNLAYLFSSIIIVAMIGLYSISAFKISKLSAVLIAGLVGVYGYVYVILQLADYALLFGSIGLAIILGLTMYLTRRVNWYKLSKPEK